MKPFDAGKKWGDSVNGSARLRFLNWADGKDSLSGFKKAMVEAERDLPESYDAFRVGDPPSVNADWIKEFCEGVRAAKPRLESGWL